MSFDTIGFIGLGLIGGSVAKALKPVHPEKTVVAYNRNGSVLDLAVKDGVVDVAVKDETGGLKNNDIDLLLKEDAENTFPVGIARRGNFLGLQRTVIHEREKLLAAHAGLFIYALFRFHAAHLAFDVKLMRGSIMLISTSPRMMDVTERTA